MNKLTSISKLVFALILSLMAALGAGVNPAHAMIYACRADPILELSDGSVLIITVDVAADPAAINKIAYDVHGPKGVEVVRVIYLDRLGIKEEVRYTADQPRGQYTADTLVAMAGPKVAVTVKSEVLGAGKMTVSGFSQSHLQTRVQQPLRLWRWLMP